MIDRSTDIGRALRRRQRGFLLNPFRFGASGPVDPYFANVATLLHFDGSNGSTSFPDSAPSPKTWTATSGAQISTTQSKFGGASLALNGSTDSISTTASADFGFGTGDFTVEGWIYPTSASAAFMCFFDNRSASNEGIAIYRGNTSDTRISVANNSAVIGGGGLLVTNTWAHWAVTRSGTTLRIFQDGSQVTSLTDSRTYAASASAFLGVNYVGSQQLQGFLDEVRITKGVARYTSTFTAPTAAFPNA